MYDKNIPKILKKKNTLFIKHQFLGLELKKLRHISLNILLFRVKSVALN